MWHKKVKRKQKPTIETVDDVYMDMIFKARYGKAKYCPNCHRPSNFHKNSDRKSWACAWCAKQLSPLANSVFHKSSTPLHKWAFAYLLILNKPSITSEELQAHLSVTYKTAWRIRNTVRQQILNSRKVEVTQV